MSTFGCLAVRSDGSVGSEGRGMAGLDRRVPAEILRRRLRCRRWWMSLRRKDWHTTRPERQLLIVVVSGDVQTGVSPGAAHRCLRRQRRTPCRSQPCWTDPSSPCHVVHVLTLRSVCITAKFAGQYAICNMHDYGHFKLTRTLFFSVPPNFWWIRPKV